MLLQNKEVVDSVWVSSDYVKTRNNIIELLKIHGVGLTLNEQTTNDYNFVYAHPVGKYHTDYCDKYKKIILEINANFWHCNPKIWQAEEIHPIIKLPAKKIWERDRKRIQYYEDHGYVVYTVWENELLKEGFNIKDYLSEKGLDYNVKDKYKNMSQEEIIHDLEKSKNQFSICIENVKNNYNIATIIRNANNFNLKEVFYIGNSHYNKRGTVGTHRYTKVTHLKSILELESLKKQYVFVGAENNKPNCVPLANFSWKFEDKKPPMILFGSESSGLDENTIKLCDYLVFAPGLGSVRSINVGSASAIFMYDLVSKLGIT